MSALLFLCRYQETALQVAVQHGREPIVRLLLEFAADVNLFLSDCNCCYPIHHAVLCGQESIVRLLLENRADVNALGG